MLIYSYKGSPQVKISQKVLGGYFLTHTVDAFVTYCCCDLDLDAMTLVYELGLVILKICL